MKTKLIRKWSRILHRDIGFFFIGTTLIYGISGIALNHMSDWNPNYSVTIEHTTIVSSKLNSEMTKTEVLEIVDNINSKNNYKQHYFPNKEQLKIFLKGGSSIVVHLPTGNTTTELLKRRPLIYESNYLHYNPNRFWTWFSDAFAAALILFALTSLFMVKGKKGLKGRGGIYTLLGILIPIIFLIFYL